MTSNITANLMAKISNLHDIPQGAHSIRRNGETISSGSTEHIVITDKKDKDGLDIKVDSECQKESLHIPVIIENENLSETVYNTFRIGGGADVTIVSGCGLHNEGTGESRHDGIHELFIGKWANVKYIENHLASGNSESNKELNPSSTFHVGSNATVTIETAQIGGVNKTGRETVVYLEKDATLIISERLLTENIQRAVSTVKVYLEGEGASARVVSRSVARDKSVQDYTFEMIGNAESKGHIACDAVIMDDAAVVSRPVVSAYNSGADLVHEAAIGRIESNQLTKLMTLGMSGEDAEEVIINGFLK